MNVNTGQIHEMLANETLEQLSKRVGVPVGDLAELSHLPDPTCRLCDGKGYRHPGMNSKRFVVCDCTHPKG